MTDNKIKKFFYTFGTDPGFPFYRGWVEVQAKDLPQADAVFRTFFPDRHSNCLNCAFVYTEDEFEKIRPNCPEEYCHARLGIYDIKE